MRFKEWHSTDLLGFVLELYRLAQETSVTEFPDLALQILKAIVGFRSATWSDARIISGAVEIRSVRLHNEPAEVRLPFSKLNQKFTRRVLDAAAQPGRASIINDTCVYYGARDEAPFREYFRRYGHERNLLITDLSQWLSLYRLARDDEFTERESALMNLLMPHLTEAIHINAALAMGDSISAKPARPAGARALIDRSGFFLHCGTHFLDLLRQQWRDWSEPRVPPSLLAAINSGQQTRIAGGDVVISAQVLGNALLLKGRQVSPLEKLSPRELQIARQFGVGKSYKAIAIEMELAPATVRNVLQKAYRKLQVDNKASLARLLQTDVD